jgi:hypothetical protein
MDKKDYNRTNALVYELILFLQRFSNFFKTNFWIKKTKATNSILKDQNLDLQPK